jgi:hypothetical protein
VRLQPMLLSVNYSSRRQRDHMQQQKQRSTSCSFRMASCCWSRSHSRRARSSAAPVTPRASASSVAVPAASLWPPAARQFLYFFRCHSCHFAPLANARNPWLHPLPDLCLFTANGTYSRQALKNSGPKQIYRNRLLNPVGINSGALSEDQEPYNSTKSRHVRVEHTWVAREDWVMRRRSSQRRTRWRSMGPRDPRAAT